MPVPGQPFLWAVCHLHQAEGSVQVNAPVPKNSVSLPSLLGATSPEPLVRPIRALRVRFSSPHASWVGSER